CECPSGTTWDGDSCEQPTSGGGTDGGTTTGAVELECVTGFADEAYLAHELKRGAFKATSGVDYNFEDVFTLDVLYSGEHGAPALTCRQDNGGWVLTGCNSAGADGYGNEQRMRDQNRCIGEYGGSAEVTARCCRIVSA
ncbi:MAG: hypothetical protein RL557_630, partial [archaeon]